MASKFICECGYTVCTNLFEGHGIFFMVSDNFIDEIEYSDTTKSIIDALLKSKKAVKCKSCGDLYLWNVNKKEYRHYKKV
jgi:hypothetical protein